MSPLDTLYQILTSDSVSAGSAEQCLVSVAHQFNVDEKSMEEKKNPALIFQSNLPHLQTRDLCAQEIEC